MRNRTGTATLAFLLAAACGLLSTGCPKKPPAAQPAPPSTETGRPPATQVPPPGTVPPGEVGTESIERQDVAAINRAGYLKDAFFDYDKSDLRDDARSVLAADADWLKKYRSIQFLIEGHCDERGTSDYNLALGDRRANAAKEYLISLGVDASRIKTVSYGKERPFCTQSTEDCWQQNRRAHLLVTAK
jgi:peptidoglycan-associated lipoprotein